MSLAAVVFFASFALGLGVLFVLARRLWREVRSLSRTVRDNTDRLATAAEALEGARPDEGSRTGVG